MSQSINRSLIVSGYDITSTIVNQALVPRPSTHRMRRQAENEDLVPDLEEVRFLFSFRRVEGFCMYVNDLPW